MNPPTNQPIVIKSIQFINNGGYGEAYRLNEEEVVKVFHDDYDKDTIEILIEDEIEGSKRPGCLPILRLINVFIEEERREAIGLVKKYLKVNYLHFDDPDLKKFMDKHDYWDISCSNCGKDEDGKIWMFDTQTEEADQFI